MPFFTQKAEGGSDLTPEELAFVQALASDASNDAGNVALDAEISAGVPDGDKGDIVVSASGATWTIDNDAVTYAKMQNVSATSRVLGRISALAGDVEELTGANIRTIANVADGATANPNALNNVVEDLTPQLGGNLDVNGKTITSASNGNVVIDPNGTGEIELGANVGIGTSNPDELLHLYKGTGEFTTMKFASAATSGYMFAYDGDNSVNLGSSSDSQVNFKQNNTTQGYIGADGNWVIKRGEGDDTILEIVAPTSDPQEATVVTKLDLGSGNAEWIDWTIENYGTDHKASINVSKSGTGTILPFVIRTWNSDLGDVATHGQEYLTISPLSEVVINESSNDVNFRVEGNGDANTLFVDAGNDRVGVGMNNPAQKLDVTGNIGVSGTIELGHASDTTLARVSAGIASIEGNNIITANITSSDTVSGVVELATAAETTTGTDAGRAVTPDGLAGSVHGTKSVAVQVFDGTTDVTVGDGKAYIVVPEALNGMDVIRATARVITAGTTNATTIDLYNVTDSVDILSTAISVASGGTLATAGTVNTANDSLATNDLLRIDVTSVSTTAPKGLVVVIEARLP